MNKQVHHPQYFLDICEEENHIKQWTIDDDLGKQMGKKWHVFFLNWFFFKFSKSAYAIWASFWKLYSRICQTKKNSEEKRSDSSHCHSSALEAILVSLNWVWMEAFWVFARMLIGLGCMVWRILAAILFELNWDWMGAVWAFAIGLSFARMFIGLGWMVWRILAAIVFELNWVWMGPFWAFAMGLSFARMLIVSGWMFWGILAGLPLSGRVRWTSRRCVSRHFSKGKNMSHKWHWNLFWLLMVCMRPHNCPVAQRLHMWGFSAIDPSCPFDDFSKDCPLKCFGRVCPLELSKDCPFEFSKDFPFGIRDELCLIEVSVWCKSELIFSWTLKFFWHH